MDIAKHNSKAWDKSEDFGGGETLDKHIYSSFAIRVIKL